MPLFEKSSRSSRMVVTRGDTTRRVMSENGAITGRYTGPINENRRPINADFVVIVPKG